MARDTSSHIDDLSEEIPPREVTLSTSTLLGLFFALALICAAFFGFGYTVGRKSTVGSGADSGSSGPVAESYKPPAGSPAIQAIPGYLNAQQAAEANKAGNDKQIYAAPATSTPVKTTAPSAPASQASPQTAAAPPAAAPAPVKESPAPPAPATPPPAPIQQVQQAVVAPPPAPASNTINYVQIAAVSRQDDADLLLKALRTRGYSVSTHQEADRLIHVQMGPFTSRKDAEAMRQRLLSDGYNAIVK